MRHRRSRLLAAATLTIGLVLIGAPAWAHVTINPDEATQGGFGAFSFRVPNERDDSGTVSLTVEFPADHPISSVSVKPKAGWTANIERAPLTEPAEGEGGEIAEAVSRITWTGGRIGPGEFDEFDVSMGPLPDDTDELVFNALQTYESGEVVRWIETTPPGGPEPEHPAPVLNLVAGGAEHGGGEDEAGGGDTEAAADDSDDNDDSETLAVVALIVGGLGLLAGVAGIVLGTRRRTA